MFRYGCKNEVVCDAVQWMKYGAPRFGNAIRRNEDDSEGYTAAGLKERLTGRPPVQWINSVQKLEDGYVKDEVCKESARSKNRAITMIVTPLK